MAREEYIGNSAFEWSAKGDNDRKKWLKELDDLCQSLEGEFNSNKHSDFEKNVTEWETT